MKKRLLLVLLTLGLFGAGFCVASFPAIAELKVITIKLRGGQRITTTVDAGRGSTGNSVTASLSIAP